MAATRVELRCQRLLAALVLLLAACAAAPPAPPAPPAPTGPAAPAGAPATAEAGAVPPAPALEAPTRPSLGLFSRIKAPTEVEPVLELAATGAQIFRCEADKDGFHWVFRLPEAELRDARGQVVGHHGANYSFEHVDGSRLIGTIVGYDSAPTENSLRWLLLRTQSYGQGEFDKMTYVQRVETSGGMPPAQCSAEQANQILRVPFSAKFIFYRPR
jgi:uncharacterized protein DUF3455